MSLLVVVPHIEGGLKPGVLEALQDPPPGVTIAPWKIEDRKYGYGRLLRSLWEQCGAAKLDLGIVEQDNVVTPETIPDFLGCPDWWCAHSYLVAERPDVEGIRRLSRDISVAYGGPYGLGCVRFRWQLMAAEPDAGRVAIERPESDKPPGHYLSLDSAMTNLLRGRIDRRYGAFEDGFLRLPRYRAHQHFPNVGHLHAYEAA